MLIVLVVFDLSNRHNLINFLQFIFIFFNSPFISYLVIIRLQKCNSFILFLIWSMFTFRIIGKLSSGLLQNSVDSKWVERVWQITPTMAIKRSLASHILIYCVTQFLWWSYFYAIWNISYGPLLNFYVTNLLYLAILVHIFISFKIKIIYYIILIESILF